MYPDFAINIPLNETFCPFYEIFAIIRTAPATPNRGMDTSPRHGALQPRPSKEKPHPRPKVEDAAMPARLRAIYTSGASTDGLEIEPKIEQPAAVTPVAAEESAVITPEVAAVIAA